MPATRILIVEDHGILREELVHFLGLSGFQADGVSCGLGSTTG